MYTLTNIECLPINIITSSFAQTWGVPGNARANIKVKCDTKHWLPWLQRIDACSTD